MGQAVRTVALSDTAHDRGMYKHAGGDNRHTITRSHHKRNEPFG
jgi:hypothetical protein